MSVIKKTSKNDKDFQPLFNRLLCPFPVDYCPEDIIKEYWKRYIVQYTCRYLFEMYLRVEGKTDNLKASRENLQLIQFKTKNMKINLRLRVGGEAFYFSASILHAIPMCQLTDTTKNLNYIKIPT